MTKSMMLGGERSLYLFGGLRAVFMCCGMVMAYSFYACNCKKVVFWAFVDFVLKLWCIAVEDIGIVTWKKNLSGCCRSFPGLALWCQGHISYCRADTRDFLQRLRDLGQD